MRQKPSVSRKAGKATLILAAAAMGALPGWAQPLPNLTVQKAADWTALLERSHGWVGGDGIFSIPLSGYEGPDHSATAKMLFVFSDSDIGDVDPVTHHLRNGHGIHNAMAVLDGGRPDSAKIRFIYGTNPDGSPTAAFNPTTPAGRGAYYWLQDGFAHKGVVYNLPLIVKHSSSGSAGFQFQETGIALIRIPLDAKGEPDLSKAKQKDTPLFYKDAKRSFNFGCGIFVNTSEAGAPDPDDSVYVYGRNSLYVARVQVDEFEDFAKWRYWDGQGWNTDIAKTASLGQGGPEISVMPITQGALRGKYLFVSGRVNTDIYMRVGDSPHGPFGNPINIYTPPERDASRGIYTYNAKAHPSLSANGEWLVTYNVNSTDGRQKSNDARIYRPRFLRLRLDGASSIASGKGGPDAVGYGTPLDVVLGQYRVDGRVLKQPAAPAMMPDGRSLSDLLSSRRE